MLPDFFLDVGPDDLANQMSSQGATPAFYKSAPGGKASTATPPPADGPQKTFQALKLLLSEDLVQKINGVFQFELSGIFDICSVGFIRGCVCGEGMEMHCTC